MTTIRTFVNSAEAGLCLSFLQANGFDAVLLDEGSFQVNYASMVVPIRLQVPEEQAAEGLALLESMREQK